MSRPWYALPEEQEHKAFLEGLEQFNAGDYYAAHDTWEEIWQDLDGRRATFYRVLIQTAVIPVLMQNRQGAGVRAVFRTVSDMLRELPDRYRGIDLAQVGRDLTAAVNWIVNRPPGAWRDVAKRTPDGEAIMFDPDRTFQIRLHYDPFVEPRAGDFEADSHQS